MKVSVSFLQRHRTAAILCSTAFAACLVAGALQGSAQAPATTPAVTTTSAKNSAAQVTSAQAAAPASGGPPLNPSLQQQMQTVPLLAGTGIDVSARSKEILSHLSAALRYYHAAVAPVQNVGEASDVLYQEQSASQAMQLTQLAFQAAKNEGALLDKIKPSSDDTGSQAQNEAQRLQTIRQQASRRVDDLEAQEAALAKQMATAKANELPGLRAQQDQIEGQLGLQKAMSDALGKIESLSDSQINSGLSGDIQRLQNAAPELLNANAKPVPPPVLENLSAVHESGVSSQAVVLFQLLSSEHKIKQQTLQIEDLRKQATDLRTPILKLLRDTIQQGQALAQSPPDGTALSPDTSAATRKRYDALTANFQVLSNIVLPLSQEIVVLDQQRSTLSTWRSAVHDEYLSILRFLLVRVASIAGALVVIFLLNQIWGRATIRYVQDLRRRRQLLVVRRTVIGGLSGLVVIFGFVTQFSSLATFAGFISAGIAVGLQTILLSVAAYFFIVGRYGVRVGDRITIAGVTGDVVEVGIARFYLTELAGSGTELHPTGRVAVFANSVLFQTGTPLYKQMPGTEYAWHELTVKLNQAANFQVAAEAVQKAVNSVYSQYKDRIIQQHRQVESWMGTALQQPEMQSRLQLAEGGLQFMVLFPVEIQNASEVDEKITEALVASINSNEQVKAAVAAPPVIKAAIKS